MDNTQEGKAEKSFKNLGKKIDELLEDLKGFKDKAAVEFEGSVEELKKNRDSIEEEIKNLKDDDRWKEAKQNLENAGKEIKKAFENAFSTRKQDDPEKSQ